MRGLWVKSCTASAPIATPRSIAESIPPAQETCAPISMPSLRYGCDVCTRAHGAKPDGAPPHRERPYGALQLALRPQPRRGVRAPDREHGHRARGVRGDGADPGVAAVARA